MGKILFIEPVECFANVIFVLLSEFALFSLVDLECLSVVSEILHFLGFWEVIFWECIGDFGNFAQNTSYFQ